MSDFVIHSYPSIYAIGHAAIKELFDGPVLIQEKIDGSQFSFGKSLDGELFCRSKGKQLILDAPEKMFVKAVAAVRNVESQLNPGTIYRGEFLSSPKHNTLSYNRVPKNNIVIYDIETSYQNFLTPASMYVNTVRLGFECVPSFYLGWIEDIKFLMDFMDRESVLGGCKVEGIVVKNYTKFTTDKKVMMGKYVSEAFKEKHTVDWKERNPGRRDSIAKLIDQYSTNARFQKAVQHLRESGQLEGSPRDIGLLMREVPADILKEDISEIKDILFNSFWQEIQRGITKGLPQWYKDQLALSAFPDQPSE